MAKNVLNNSKVCGGGRGGTALGLSGVIGRGGPIGMGGWGGGGGGGGGGQI